MTGTAEETKAKISDEQRRVLKLLRTKGPSCAQKLRTGIRTMIALADRRLIYVDTTFESIMYPRNARASITDAGRSALRK